MFSFNSPLTFYAQKEVNVDKLLEWDGKKRFLFVKIVQNDVILLLAQSKIFLETEVTNSITNG